MPIDLAAIGPTTITLPDGEFEVWRAGRLLFSTARADPRTAALEEAATLIADFTDFTGCPCWECTTYANSHGTDLVAARRDMAAAIRALATR